MERTEALLIADLCEGDETALAPLVEKYKRMVYRLADADYQEPYADADDVMQETFIKVYRSIRTFRKDAAFETWLYRIAVNEALNFVKRRERQRESLHLRQHRKRRMRRPRDTALKSPTTRMHTC